MKYQEFLIGKKFTYKIFVSNAQRDHEHCNMCGEKFSEKREDAHWGYEANDGIGWVCDQCFEEYKQEYRWTRQE